MDKIAWFYPEGHQAHYEPGHPERPERVEAIREALKQNGWWDAYPHLAPADVPRSVLESVHTPRYLAILQAASAAGMHMDGDTYTTPASWTLALNAAGGAAAAAAAVWRGEAQTGFALCRPPGHHATPGRGMGFCLLNNIAIAAEYLISQEGAQRLAIVDLDLHHGNGTQEVFYQRADVFYCSTHQSPLYPGTGRVTEIGEGPGLGANANLPLPPGSGDQAFEACFQDIILPLLDRYQPEMILASVGYDSHWLDPLGSLQVSAAGMASQVRHLKTWSDRQAGGKIALILEGGYDLDACAAGASGMASVLLGEAWEDPLGPAPQVERTTWKAVIQQAREVWKL